jgi:hypothetical protein
VKLGPLLTGLRELEVALAEEYRTTGERHTADHDVHHQCQSFALQCERHAEALDPHAARYGENEGAVWSMLFESPLRLAAAADGLVLLRDLQALLLAAEEASITWVIAGQAALAARDAQLLDTVTECHTETELQVKWLTTRIKVGAPQALVVGR